MKVGIDSYCYHRFMGGAYPDLERDPGFRLTVFDVLARARALGVDGVSIEACFLPAIDAPLLDRLAAMLAGYRLEPVWAWGHPNGLSSGTDPAAADDLVRHLGYARQVGARVMRICAGGRRTRPASWPDHKAKLVPMLQRLVGPAEDAGVVMAVENHIDLLADEMVELIETIDSPWLGVCYDTANNLRMFEDPVAVARKLAPLARATHIKDITAQRGDPKTFAFWPSVPLGRGLIDVPAILGLLRDAGFDGLLALEIDYLSPLYFGDSEEAAIAESIGWLRREVDTLVSSRVRGVAASTPAKFSPLQ
jgi:sugar phosphate isomerase/epimerase